MMMMMFYSSNELGPFVAFEPLPIFVASNIVIKEDNFSDQFLGIPRCEGNPHATG